MGGMALLRFAARVAISGARDAVNVWHFTTPANSGAQVQAAVDAVRDFYTAVAAFYLNAATISIGVDARDIGTTPPTILSPTVRTVVGTASGSLTAQQLAQVVSWRTAFAGRSARGRTYLGPAATAALSGNAWSTSVTTAAQNAANALIAASIASADFQLIVHSRPRPLDTPPYPGAEYDVLSAIVNTRCETQRRRNAP